MLEASMPVGFTRAFAMAVLLCLTWGVAEPVLAAALDTGVMKCGRSSHSCCCKKDSLEKSRSVTVSASSECTGECGCTAAQNNFAVASSEASHLSLAPAASNAAPAGTSAAVESVPDFLHQHPPPSSFVL